VKTNLSNSLPFYIPATGVYPQLYAPAASPLAWTDLDASAFGARQHLLIISVINRSGAGANSYAFRANGNLLNNEPIGHAGGVLNLTNDLCATITVLTDEAGIIEWVASANTNTEIILLGSIG